MAAQKGFCPYCAHVNPPDYVFCIRCQRKLPDDPTAVARPGVSPSIDGPVPTEEAEPSSPKGARWVILVFTVALAAIVVVAGISLLPRILTSSSPEGGRSGKLVAANLCVPTSGTGCRGSQYQLPYTLGGSSRNVTPCLTVYSPSTTARLVVNFTSSSNVFGVIVPQVLFNGPVASYYSDPAGFYNNSTAAASAAWVSPILSGPQLVNVSLPSAVADWCLAWWDTGQSTTITFAQNLTLLAEPIP